MLLHLSNIDFMDTRAHIPVRCVKQDHMVAIGSPTNPGAPQFKAGNRPNPGFPSKCTVHAGV